MLNWYGNLKKWQKGALIGLIIGIILGFLESPLGFRIPFIGGLGQFVGLAHYCFWYFADWFHTGNTYSASSFELYNFILPIIMIILYCGVGAAWGGILQLNDRGSRRLFLALLIIALLVFYVVNAGVFISAMSF